MEVRPSKFMEQYRRGLEKQKINIQQAIAIIKGSLQHFHPNQGDLWYEYYTVQLQLAGIMRDNGQLMNSRSIFIDVINQLKHPDINERVRDFELKQLNFSAFQNYAKILIQLAEEQIIKDTQDFNINYDIYRKNMNGSYNYFRQAQKILLSILQVQVARQAIVKDQQIEWYIRLLSNFNQFFFLQVNYFWDQNCMNSILAITESVEKLFQLNKHQKKVFNELQTHLYRCYYYKSIVLDMKNQTKAAIQLMMKVYNYEKKHDLKNDAEKSRQYIFQMMLNVNDLKQIHVYFDRSKKLVIEKQIKEVKLRRQIMKSTFESSLKLKRKLTIVQIESQLEEFQQKGLCDYTYDRQLVDELIERSLFLYQRKQQKCLLYYFLAQVNYKLRKYEKSLKCVRQSIKFFSSDVLSIIDLRIEELKIRCQVQPSNNQLPLLFLKLRQEINTVITQSNKENLHIVNSQLQQLMKQQYKFVKIKRKYMDQQKYIYQSVQEKKLIVQLERMQKKYERQKQGNRQSKNMLDQKQMKSNVYQFKNNTSSEGGQSQKNISFARLKQNQKLYIINPLQAYIKQCKQKNVIERDIIKKILKNQLKENNFNVFQQMISLSIEELQILLTYLKVNNLDLRNHRLNDYILQHVLNYCDLNIIQKFKINGTNLISNELLMKIISKMNQLSYLSFIDFSSCRPRSFNLLEVMNNEHGMDIQEQKPRSIVHVLYLLGYQNSLSNIKILKLKYCNIIDDHLREIKFDHYQNIEEISLSHNLIQGNCFDQVMKLRKISKLNFSDNPLTTLSFQKWKYRFSEHDFRISILKLSKIKFQRTLRQQVKFAIARVESIYLNESSQLGELVDQISENSLQGINLFFLTKIVMKNVNLDLINIHNLLNMSRYMKQIDLRGCSFSFNTKKQIEYERILQINLKIQISNDQQQFFVHNMFSLIPVKR